VPHTRLLLSNPRGRPALPAGPPGRYTPPARPLASPSGGSVVPSPFVRGLKCRLCGKQVPVSPANFCQDDFGPLEVDYDYEALAEAVTRAKVELRPFTMWRYRDLLPLDGEPTVGRHVGGTPLLKADRLAEALGVERLWIKNDAVNFPSLSFKDRVVAVALSKAREFGFTTVGCASPGNLANSVAANAPAPPAWPPSPPLPPPWGAPGPYTPASAGPRPWGPGAPTAGPPASARRSPTASAGAWSTSTCGRSTPRAPRPSATRSPSSWAGA